MKCLIVDTDRAQRFDYSRIMGDLGFICFDTDRVEQSLHFAKQHEFDIILMDLTARDGSTIGLVDYLDVRGAPCSILLITGSGDFPHGEITSLWPRIDFVLRKPLNLSDLKELVAYLSKIPPAQDAQKSSAQLRVERVIPHTRKASKMR